jgi:hypothetical protein
LVRELDERLGLSPLILENVLDARRAGFRFDEFDSLVVRPLPAWITSKRRSNVAQKAKQQDDV